MPTDACQFYYECTNCKTAASTNTWRLLRLLLVWHGALSADLTQLAQLGRGRRIISSRHTKRIRHLSDWSG